MRMVFPTLLLFGRCCAAGQLSRPVVSDWPLTAVPELT